MSEDEPREYQRSYRDLTGYDPEHVPFYDAGDGVWRYWAVDAHQFTVVVPQLNDSTVHIDTGDERTILQLSEARRLMAALAAAVGQVEARGTLTSQQLGRVMTMAANY